MVGKEFIEERLKEMKANGVAVGSLISYVPSYGNTGTTTIAYVTKIVTENRSPTWRWLEKYFHEKQMVARDTIVMKGTRTQVRDKILFPSEICD